MQNQRTKELISARNTQVHQQRPKSPTSGELILVEGLPDRVATFQQRSSKASSCACGESVFLKIAEGTPNI